jgi:Ca-activated chloride channel family protein
LYELIPPGAPLEGARVDPLKYQEAPRATASSHEGELMTVKIRYKEPDGDSSRLLSVAVRDDAGRPGSAPRNDHDARTRHAECDANMNASLGFAAAVAEFGMLLRDSEFKGEATWDSAQRLARQHRGDDPDGYRAEFVRLVDLAAALAAQKERPVVESR